MKITVEDLPGSIYVNSEGNFDKVINLLEKNENSIAKICGDKKLYGRILWWKNNGGLLKLGDYRKIYRRLGLSIKELNVDFIRGRTGRKVYINLPIKTNYWFGRLLGHLAGDGSLFKGGTGYRPNYGNKEKELINAFEECAHKVFGKFDTYLETKEGGHYDVILPAILGRIIVGITDEEFRTKEQRVPFDVLDNKEAKKGYLQSIFSDDGTMGEKARQISIRLSNRKLVEDLKELLSNFKIETSKIRRIKRNKHTLGGKEISGGTGYGITISGRFLRRFVGFVPNTRKDKLLNKVVRGYKVEKSNVMGETREKIIEMIKERPRSTKEIQDEFEYGRHYIRTRLWELRDEGKIVKMKRCGGTPNSFAVWGLKGRDKEVKPRKPLREQILELIKEGKKNSREIIKGVDTKNYANIHTKLSKLRKKGKIIKIQKATKGRVAMWGLPGRDKKKETVEEIILEILDEGRKDIKEIIRESKFSKSYIERKLRELEEEESIIKVKSGRGKGPALWSLS